LIISPDLIGVKGVSNECGLDGAEDREGVFAFGDVLEGGGEGP
jgi:hypothetical protein